MRAEASRRRLKGEDDDDSELDEEEAEVEGADAGSATPQTMEYRIEATGARVSLAGAKSLLFHYCSRLPTDMQVLPSHFTPSKAQAS